MLIGVVGACGAGKSSLVAGLRGQGYNVRHIAQEHSYVPDMWQRLTNPDILIYLEVSYPNTVARRKLNWTYQEYAEQLQRLRHARQHADLLIDTNSLSLQQVLGTALSFIKSTNPQSYSD
jgi:flagellar biosynthesis/type III secretory pathway chaperone